MDLNDLALFLAVSQTGSFSGAARRLRVSPSHVSRRIAALELALERRLFQRTTRSMALTQAGRDYERQITPLLEALQDASRRLAEGDETPRGLLRVACPLAFAHEHLVPWFDALQAKHPKLELDLVLDYARNDLVEDRIDVAIRLGVLRPSSLVARKLCAMPRMVVASPKYLEGHGVPTQPGDIAVGGGHRALVFPYDGHGGRWSFRDGRGRRSRIEVPVSARVTDGLTLRRMALRGMGLTLLPRWLVASEVHAGSLVQLFPRHDVTSTDHDGGVWIVYPSRTYVPLKVRVFVDDVVQRFAAGPPWERVLQ